MKKLFHVLTLTTLLLLLPGCSSHTDGNKPVVTVSLAPQKYILEQITGDRVDIKCLLPNGGNPESYEPSFANMRDLEKSVLYLRAGNIEFENQLLGRIAEVSPNLTVVDTSAGIDLIEGTHSHEGHSHGDGRHEDIDPHTWGSVKNARIIARNMRDAMVKADPANASLYNANFTRFDNRLDSLDRAIAARLAPIKGRTFIVWHPSLSYFARDYGLRQVSIGHSTKESSIPDLQHAIDEGVFNNAAVFFIQKEMDSRQVLAVNSTIGARCVEINPVNPNWEEGINLIVNALDPSTADTSPHVMP